MIAIDQYACFALIVEVRSEVHTAHHMPAAFELLFEVLFYILSSVFEIGNFIFDHLYINILCDLQGVLFHINLHVAEFDVC
jgi:hypothetical protein